MTEGNQFMKNVSYIIIVFSLLISVNCQHQRVRLLEETQTQTPKEDVIIKNKFYLWGLFPRKVTVDISEICESGKMELVHQYENPADAIWAQVTFGIYYPRTIRVKCQ